MFAAILFALIGLACAAGALFLALMVGTMMPEGRDTTDLTKANMSSIRFCFCLSIAAQTITLLCAAYLGSAL